MIEVIKVKDRLGGNLKAHDILKTLIDPKTLLALSGGTSPDYAKMIVNSDILPGAVCLVDERYGEPFHENSNETLLKNQGVFEWAERNNIEVNKILSGKGFEETGKDYDQLISELIVKFPKKVGVMGIGGNSHTAGIFPESIAAKSGSLVVGEDVNGQFPKRITLTFRALVEFFSFVILAFGEEKKAALLKMTDEEENDIAKYPAIFYRTCPAKSFLITDVNL